MATPGAAFVPGLNFLPDVVIISKPSQPDKAIAGRLGLIRVVPGQTLSPGTVVAEVIDLSEVDVLCFVPPSRRPPGGLQGEAMQEGFVPWCLGGSFLSV